jgi:formylglycine-generating enzyme required for sulfatase activity
MGWYESNSGGLSHRVGQKQANAWGLFDIQGNVAEWTGDWYGSYSASTVTDPVGSVTSRSRVIRGGSWDSIEMGDRTARRNYGSVDAHSNTLGLRLVRTNP